MTHAEFRPGRSDCPGRIYLAYMLERRRGVRDVHACAECGWTDDPRPAARPAAERAEPAEPAEPADQLAGARPMKLKLCVHRKVGAPNYGSDGAGAELEIDIDDALAAKPQSLVDAAAHWYSVLERSVAAELERLQAAHPAPAPAPAPGPAEGPAAPRSRPMITPEAPAGDYGRRPRAAGGSGAAAPVRDDPPRNGRQLLGWAAGHGMSRELTALTKAWGVSWRVADWGPDDVQAAYDELARRAQPRPGWGGS